MRQYFDHLLHQFGNSAMAPANPKRRSVKNLCPVGENIGELSARLGEACGSH